MGDRKYEAVVGMAVRVAVVAGTVAGLAIVASNAVSQAAQAHKQKHMDNIGVQKKSSPRSSSSSISKPKGGEDWKWQELCGKYLVIKPYHAPKQMLSGFAQEWRSGSWKKLTSHTAWHCFHMLGLEDIATCMSVCKSWNRSLAFIQTQISHWVQCSIRGFPPSSRGACWSRIRKLVSRPEDARPYQLLLQMPAPEKCEIDKDVDRTLTRSACGALYQQKVAALGNLLHAYVVADPEVGYCQGMNFVAATVLMVISDEEEAFNVFFMLMAHVRYNLREFYREDLRGLKLAKYQFDCLVQWYHPKIAAHLKDLDLWEGANYNTPWFMTLFSRGEIKQDTVLRIWDYIIAEGYRGLFQVGLAILDAVQDKLLLMDYESTFHFLKRLDDLNKIPADLIIRSAARYQVPHQLLTELRTHFRLDIEKTYLQ